MTKEEKSIKLAELIIQQALIAANFYKAETDEDKFVQAVQFKMIETEIQMVLQTPMPKYPYGGSSGLIRESGKELIISDGKAIVK